MFVELIYDKRNFAGLPGAREAILNELTKRMQRIFPEAEVRVKPMMTLPAINTDASKHEKELRSAVRCRKMFEEADMWLTEE
ncbi:DinI family protein [Klebsiella variicola subsp. variicola]|nr:DinI family protein [Klebsiella variicola subsp. variicola]